VPVIKVTYEFGRLYLGNKMVGKDGLNAAWFDETAARLRKIPGVTEVFNPAEQDRTTGFKPEEFTGKTFDELAAAGFDRRAALLSDWTWIGKFSNGMVVGPDWDRPPASTGTISEIACHQSLFLPVWPDKIFFANYEDPEWLLNSPLAQLPSFRYLI